MSSLRRLALALFVSAALFPACKGDEPEPTPEPSGDTVDDTDNADAGESDLPECTPGEETCPCDDGACADGLVCNDADVCEAEESCAPGTTACECLGDGTCADPSDECVEANVCVPRTTCEGELGCPCDGDACDDGLACIDSLCRVENGVIVSLQGHEVRACDVLVDSPDRLTAQVVFPAGVRGTHRARGPRTAISLLRTADDDLAGPVAAIVFTDSAAASPADVGAISATCYNRRGELVADALPTVQ